MNENSITKEHVDSILAASQVESVKLGPKTTVVQLTLPNGFTITETSSCVDPENYNHDLGVEIASKRCAEKIWMLEGYLLQEKLFQS